MTDEHRSRMRAACRFAFELGHLKRLPRAGWLVAGTAERIESVADHSHRVALLAFTIAAAENVPNPDRAATLGAFHDVHETRIGDIPHAYRPYITAAHPDRITLDQTEGMSPAVASAIRQVVAEFEGQETAEARAAHDADRLDCLFQALQYQAAGVTGLEAWVDSSSSGLRTDTARSMSQEALTIRPGEWHSIA